MMRMENIINKYTRESDYIINKPILCKSNNCVRQREVFSSKTHTLKLTEGVRSGQCTVTKKYKRVFHFMFTNSRIDLNKTSDNKVTGGEL